MHVQLSDSTSAGDDPHPAWDHARLVLRHATAPGDPQMTVCCGAAGKSTQTREAFLIQSRDLHLDKPLVVNFNYFRDLPLLRRGRGLLFVGGDPGRPGRNWPPRRSRRPSDALAGRRCAEPGRFGLRPLAGHPRFPRPGWKTKTPGSCWPSRSSSTRKALRRQRLYGAGRYRDPARPARRAADEDRARSAASCRWFPDPLYTYSVHPSDAETPAVTSLASLVEAASAS